VIFVDATAVRGTTCGEQESADQSCSNEFLHFMPKNLPNLARRPVRERGMPVVREIFRLAAVIPSARFQENVSPGPNFMPLTVSVPFLLGLGRCRGGGMGLR
jgi:hypothetical protein